MSGLQSFREERKRDKSQGEEEAKARDPDSFTRERSDSPPRAGDVIGIIIILGGTEKTISDWKPGQE
jgi:hypothetical protein